MCRLFRSVLLPMVLSLAATRARADRVAPTNGLGNAPVTRTVQIPHERFVLGNGLEVIVISDHRMPLVAVNVWYHVGSGDETPGKSGFAHLFEHMLFQGSANVPPDQHFAILREAGAAEVNGTTNPNRTNYYEVVPTGAVETALWLESDRMGMLLPRLTEEALRNQIDVVRNERRQRYDNAAGGKTRFALYAALYPEGHPYRYLTIGRHEELEAATLAEVRSFYRTWYSPANATLALAGDIDVATAKRLAQKWFGSLPMGQRPVHKPPAAVAQAPARVNVTDPMLRRTTLTWAWHSPKVWAPGAAELDVIADALTREGTGRLYQALVPSGLATDVSAYQSSQRYAGVFSIEVVLAEGTDAARVEAVVADVLTRVRDSGVTMAERVRAVRAIEARAVRRLETLLGRAEMLQQLNHETGNTDLAAWLAQYQTMTDAATKSAAGILDAASAVVVKTVPEQTR